MNYKESYDDWTEEVGILKDSESLEAWEHQQGKIDALKELVKTYKNMPFPCHDYMTKEQWETICHICHEGE